MANFQFAEEYTWDTYVASYQVGPDESLRLSDMMKLQQEVGERHFGEAALTIDAMAEMGMAFVLTRGNSVIYRLPRLGERFLLTTWQREVIGAQFYRCYHFAAVDGTPLIDSVGAFALVDTQSHRLLRPAALIDRGVRADYDRHSSCPDPVKWRLPAALTDAGERPIYWSDIDWNGHVNNTKYIDMLCDFVPGGLAGRRITGLSMQFLREARPGDVLRMRTGTEMAGKGETLYVAGAHSRGVCFETKMTVVPA